EVTNAPFAVKAGFGFSAFVSIGFTIVLGLVASSFWYNADETRRLKRDAFDVLMKVKFVILVLCAILAWSMYINMNFAKRQGRNIAVGGLTRAIMNYDKGQSANFPNDKCGLHMFCYVPWSCCRKEVATCTHAIFQLLPDSPLHTATLSDKGCVDALSADFVLGAENLMTI
uniref:Uncharacterized protein n=1 Tax=Romanomermis culicivorax TaxID=13658 RepID=A0A915I3Q0_ROMCU